jgi:hypothetical protein
MNSSGILKRGLAATAISALAVAGIPALAGTAHAAVGVTVANPFAAYDFDEFGDATKDFVVTVKDGNTLINNQAVEFSYVFTPEGGQPQAATAYAAGGTTDATGTVDLEFNPAAAGTYTVTVRTVGSHISAAPFTFVAGEGEITWADGVSVRSPQNGSDTYAGTLTLDNAAATPLSGRTVDIDYNSAGDVIMSTPQPAGTARVNDDEATATTGADGGFSVGLTDAAAPLATDSGTLIADTSFTPAAALSVSFEPAPVVKAITVATDNVYGSPAPGRPVELDIKVTSEGPTDAPGDDVVLKDAPVVVTVDAGFLTPDTQGEGMNVDPAELALTADQDDENDLFGFYENLTNSTTVDTSDDAGNPANNAAGIVATIEKDAGFVDDGQVTQTVTVTAGGKSAQTTIDYDSSNYLNLPAAAFVRDSGVAKVPGPVELKLFAADQYGNLVGGESANVTDNTPVARVDAENGGVTTDFVNDNPSVTASSKQAVTQVITANIGALKTLVNASGAPVQSNASTTASYTINWKGGATKTVATLSGNGGAKDKLRVSTTPGAKGAIATLYKIVKGKKQQVGTKALNKGGKATFVTRDRNGSKVTKYFVKVASTNKIKGDRSNTARVK